MFVRGVTPVWSGEQLNLFAQKMVTLTQEPEAIDLKFKTSFGEVTGHENVYKPIIEALSKGPMKISELSKALPSLNVGSILQSISLLAHGNAVGFFVPDAKKKPAIQFNQVIAEAVSRGAPYRYFALPSVGSGYTLDEIQYMALDAYNKGATTLEAMATGVEQRLKGLNKSILREGNPVPHGEETVKELTARLEAFVSKTLPMLKRLGGIK